MGGGTVKYSSDASVCAESLARSAHLAACQMMMPSMTSTMEQTIARIHIFFRDFCCDKESRHTGLLARSCWMMAFRVTAADSPGSRRLSGAALLLVLHELQHSPHLPRCYLQGGTYSKVSWEITKSRDSCSGKCSGLKHPQ